MKFILLLLIPVLSFAQRGTVSQVKGVNTTGITFSIDNSTTKPAIKLSLKPAAIGYPELSTLASRNELYTRANKTDLAALATQVTITTDSLKKEIANLKALIKQKQDTLPYLWLGKTFNKAGSDSLHPLEAQIPSVTQIQRLALQVKPPYVVYQTDQVAGYWFLKPEGWVYIK